MNRILPLYYFLSVICVVHAAPPIKAPGTLPKVAEACIYNDYNAEGVGILSIYDVQIKC